MPQSDVYGDVEAFHLKFGIPAATTPSLLDPRTAGYRTSFMLEELTEFSQSHGRGDLAEAADALVDLVYVAVGTAVLMGLPWDALWEEVQRANMSKERGPTSKRGSPIDVRKPAGWRAPDHLPALARASGFDLDDVVETTGPTWPTFDPLAAGDEP